MKKKKIWVLLLAVIMLFNTVGMQGYFVKNTKAKEVDTETHKGVNRISTTRITETQAKKVKLYQPVKNGKISLFSSGAGSDKLKYGYNQIKSNRTYQSAYNLLESAMDSFHNSNNNASAYTSRGEQYYGAVRVNLHDISLSRSKMHLVLSSLYYDHPEYYWLNHFSYTYNSATSDVVEEIIAVCDSAYKTGTVRAELTENMNKEIARYVSLAASADNEYDKEKIIHDELINKNRYATYKGSPSKENWAHSIVGIFDTSKRQAVCEGYAKAFKLLMTECGIECIYIPGTAGGEAHSWNKVKLFGEWYNVDTTWDDPITNNGKPVLSHSYFNKTDAQFKDHLPGSSKDTTINAWCYTLPTSSKTEITPEKIEIAQTKGDTKVAETFTINSTSDMEGVVIRLLSADGSDVTGTKIASGTSITVEASLPNLDHHYSAACQINDDAPFDMGECSPEGKYTSSFTMPARDTTVLVSLKLLDKYYDISFNTKGGNTIETMKDILGGTTITLPVPLYSGHIFKGWFTNETYTVEFTDTTTVTQSLTLYAKWEEASLTAITASYNGNNVEIGKEFNKSDIIVTGVYEDGSRKIIEASLFTIDEPDNIIKFDGANTVKIKYKTFDTSVTIFGYPKIEQFTVTFDTLGGNEIAPITEVSDGAVIEFPNIPEKNEYFFSGWYTEKSTLNKFDESTPIKSNITLYAKWIPLLSNPKTTISKVEAIYSGQDLIVGRTIDKDKIKVTVTDTNGSKHIVSDYKLSSLTVPKEGSNTITVTYGEKTASFIIHGLRDPSIPVAPTRYVTFISAAYHGGPVEVGSKVDRSNISVALAYNDNTISYSMEFTIYNETITTVGDNTVTVYSNGYTTTVKVPGVPKGSLKPVAPVAPTTTTTVVQSTSSMYITTASNYYMGHVTPKMTITTREHASTMQLMIEPGTLSTAISNNKVSKSKPLKLSLDRVSDRIYNELNKSNVSTIYVDVCLPVQYYGREDVTLYSLGIDSLALIKLKSLGKTMIIRYLGYSTSSTNNKTTYTSPLYSLKLKGSDITSYNYCDANLKVNTLDKEYVIQSKVNNYLALKDRDKGLIVTYGLKSKTRNLGEARINVGAELSKSKGDYAYVYGYNTTLNRLEELPVTKYLVNKEQEIIVPVGKYTKYVVLPQETKVDVVSVVSRTKVVTGMYVYAGDYRLISITMPSGISIKNASVKYSSSNRNTAYVTTTGRVYGMQPGKAIITTTIRYGTEIKSFKTTVIVK